MSEIRLEITKDETPELMAKLESAIGRFIRKGTALLEGSLKVSITEPKSGRMYGSHQASAPGESPANDTSNLLNSITQIHPSELHGMVGTPVEYARYLEDGTSRMAARPLWEKTRADELPTLEKLLDAEIRGIATR